MCVECVSGATSPTGCCLRFSHHKHTHTGIFDAARLIIIVVVVSIVAVAVAVVVVALISASSRINESNCSRLIKFT